jgi:predicted RNase H-like nuclease (RuvC/YqgF family)
MSRSLGRLARRWLGAVLAPAADPRTMAGASDAAGDRSGLSGLERHEALLAQVRRAHRASAAARERLEARTAALRERGQPAAATSLERHRQQVQAQEYRLAQAAAHLAAQIEALQARQEAIVAQTQANEALEDLWQELDGVGAAVAEAEQTTEQLEARLQALDDLAAAGLLSPLDPVNSLKSDVPGHGDPAGTEAGCSSSVD